MYNPLLVQSGFHEALASLSQKKKGESAQSRSGLATRTRGGGAGGAGTAGGRGGGGVFQGPSIQVQF